MKSPSQQGMSSNNRESLREDQGIDQALFQDAFGSWLEVHGVTLGEAIGNKYVSTIDLNVLKPAIMELMEFRAALAQQEAEWTGRHAEVVKALFLIESLGGGYDIQPWLKERLSELSTTNPTKEQSHE